MGISQLLRVIRVCTKPRSTGKGLKALSVDAKKLCRAIVFLIDRVPFFSASALVLSVFLSVALGFMTPLLSAPAQAGLLGDKHPFKLFVANNSALKKDIETVLEEQRDDNIKYQRASSLSVAARYDRLVIEAYLRSQGYYASRTESRTQKDTIVHQVFLGQRFVIDALALDWPEDVGQPPQDVLNMQKGDPLVATQVLDQQAALKAWVEQAHCLKEIDVSYTAMINRQTHTAQLTFHLAPSPQVVFGEVFYSGQTSIEPRYLDRFLDFEVGDCYKPILIDNTRLKLLQTNLLANVDPIEEEVEGSQVPIHLWLTERKQRSIGAGIGYDTDVKTKLTGTWQHRNLLGQGEQLTTELVISSINKSLGANLVLPFFGGHDQRLTLDALLEEEESDAYFLRRGLASAILQRDVTKRLSARAGVKLTFSRIEEAGIAEEDMTKDGLTEKDMTDEGMVEEEMTEEEITQRDIAVEVMTEDFALLSFPLSIDYNTRNDALNPTKGWAVGLQVEPFIDLSESNTRFYKTTLAASGYHTWDDVALQPTLALRFATGFLDGAGRDEVPRDELFYVGGGGSVRGYRYQSIGDFDKAGAPAGGLSFGETSIELRTKITESIGLTFFTDGGYAYAGRSPSNDEAFLWGAGIGLRFHTSFAPFRVDLATPLKSRKTAKGKSRDDRVNLYIGIGQAF